jgi:hypothetical protein
MLRKLSGAASASLNAVEDMDDQFLGAHKHGRVERTLNGCADFRCWLLGGQALQRMQNDAMLLLPSSLIALYT